MTGDARDLQSRQPGVENRSDRRARIADRVRTTIFVDDAPQDPGASSGKLRLVREGVTRDLSVGGACVALETGTVGLPVERLVGRTVKLRLELGTAGLQRHLDTLGRVAWGKEEPGRLVLGVQFVDTPEHDQKVLEQHCLDDSGAQSLLDQLWRLRVAVAGQEERKEP